MNTTLIPIIILLVITFLSLVYWLWRFYYYIPNKEKEFAKKFFVKNLKQYSFEHLKEVKKIHNGYTNLSFYIKTIDNHEYQLRFAKNNHIVDRNNEKKIIMFLNKQDYLYLDQFGNYIKKWIKGRDLNLNDIDDLFWKRIKSKIDYLHSINVKELNLLKNDYKKVLSNKKISKKLLIKYEKYLSILNEQEWVFSHNDLNYNNIIVNENKELIFIDYEWSRINHPYWDIVNFCRESHFSFMELKNVAIKFDIEFDKFMKMYFICLLFAYNWTFENSFSFKIWKYRLGVKKQIFKIFKYLEKLGI